MRKRWKEFRDRRRKLKRKAAEQRYLGSPEARRIANKRDEAKTWGTPGGFG